MSILSNVDFIKSTFHKIDITYTLGNKKIFLALGSDCKTAKLQKYLIFYRKLM